MGRDDYSTTEPSNASDPETERRRHNDAVLAGMGWQTVSESNAIPPIPWGALVGAIVIAGVASALGVPAGTAVLLGCGVSVGFELAGRFVERVA